MGFIVSGFCFLIFVYLIDLASSHPIQKTLPSEFVPRSQLEDKGIYGSKLGGGGAHGGAHVGAHGGQAHGNGHSNSPKTQGGGAVIPIYAAGAANKNSQHQRHRSAASCSLNKIKISTMFMMTFCLFSHTVILLR